MAITAPAPQQAQPQSFAGSPVPYGYGVPGLDPAFNQYQPLYRQQAYRVPAQVTNANTWSYPGFGRDPDLNPPPPAAAPAPRPAPAPAPAPAPPPAAVRGGLGGAERRSYTDPGQERRDAGLGGQPSEQLYVGPNGEIFAYPGQFDLMGVSYGTGMDTWGRAYDGAVIDPGELVGSIGGGFIGGPVAGMAAEYLGGQLTGPEDNAFIQTSDEYRYVNDILTGAVPATENEILAAQDMASRMVESGQWTQNPTTGQYGPVVQAPPRRPIQPPPPQTLTPGGFGAVAPQRTSGGSQYSQRDGVYYDQAGEAVGVSVPGGQSDFAAMPGRRPENYGRSVPGLSEDDVLRAGEHTSAQAVAAGGAQTRGAPSPPPSRPGSYGDAVGLTPGYVPAPKTLSPTGRIPTPPSRPGSFTNPEKATKKITPPATSKTVAAAPKIGANGTGKSGDLSATATRRGGVYTGFSNFRDDNEARAAKAAAGRTSGGLKTDREGRSDREQAARDEKASRGDTSGGLK